MPLPRVRPLEAVQIEHEGRPYILLSDPEGLLEEQIVVPVPFFVILGMMDGTSEVTDIQQELLEVTGGQIVPSDMIQQVVEEADRLYLLDNERAHERREEIERAYAASPTRRASHAGISYPDDPDECAHFFGELFNGLMTGGQGSAPGRVRGLIVPHIDYRVGGRTIARGFASLDPERPARLYVILGVAHAPTANLFTVDDKDFETPLGTVTTDRDAVARLRELCGAERLDGAAAHRTEHSVEFAAVALRHLHGEAPVAIVPVLCGSLHEALHDGVKPGEIEEVRVFVDALRQLIEEYGGDVCVVASVDMSHVGLKFGDAEDVDDTRAEEVRQADMEMIDRIHAMDAEGFFDHFRADCNARNVDAVTAVYVLLKTLGAGEGRLIEYDQWREEETGSMVTYASMAIH